MIKLPAFFAESFRKPSGVTGIITGWIMKKYYFFVYPEIEKYSELQNGMKILEIGYGPGEGVKYFLDKYNARMDGVDFSEQMYKKAKKRNNKAIDNGRLRLYTDDFLTMDFDEEKYDLILFANVIYFWNDLTSAFTKIKSLLKDESKLVFYMTGPEFLKRTSLTDNKHFEHYEIETVLHTLCECGFTSSECIKMKDDSGNFNIIRAIV